MGGRPGLRAPGGRTAARGGGAAPAHPPQGGRWVEGSEGDRAGPSSVPCSFTPPARAPTRSNAYAIVRLRRRPHSHPGVALLEALAPRTPPSSSSRGRGEGGRPSTGASSAASAPAGWAGPGLRVTEDSGGSSRPGSEHSEPAWAQHRPHRPLGLSKLATMMPAGQGRRAVAADAAAGGGRAARMSWGGGPLAALAAEPRSFDPGGTTSEVATTGSSTPRLSRVLSDQSLSGEACGSPRAAGSEERQPTERQEWQQEPPGAVCAGPQALLRAGRLAAEKLVAHPDFNLLVLLLILASCVQLALYRPLEPDGSPWNAALGRVGEWLCGGWAGPVHGGCGHKEEVAEGALHACN